MIRLLPPLLALLALAAAGVGLAVAQDEDKSRFVRFVERQISTPDRQIRLGAIEGALSSDVRISEITIADRQGVWLTIENARLVWSRLALLRGRLDIDLLEAHAITVSRAPLSSAAEERAVGGVFALPELPVAVIIDRLAVPTVEIAEGVVGPAATLGVGGAVTLRDGELDARVAVERRDRPGSLTLIAAFANETRRLSLDISLSEPEDGVIANALGIEGQPPLAFALRGEGPLSDFSAELSLAASGETLLTGSARISDGDDAVRFSARIEGNLEPLVSAPYEPLVAGGTTLAVDGTRAADGTLVIGEGAFRSGVSQLTFSARTAPDGVPTQLAVAGTLARADGEPVLLPGGDGEASVRSATIDISLGAATDDSYSASVVVEALRSAALTTPRATLRAMGVATNLADPATRRLTFDVAGEAGELASRDARLADALGTAVSLVARGAWQAGSPVRVDVAELLAQTVEARFAGSVGDALSGDYRLAAADLSLFAALADRPLAGAVDLEASGRIGFDGMFDLTVDGQTRDLAVGVEAADGLLEGTARISGRAARSAQGIAFDSLRVASPQLTAAADGAVNDTVADLSARLELSALSALDPRAEGTVRARLSVSGNPSVPTIGLALESERAAFAGQSVTGLDARFDGTLDRTAKAPFALGGTLDVNGTLDGEPLTVAATLATREGARSLTGLRARVAGATANGAVTLLPGGLVNGALSLDIPQIERLAALVLSEAEGSVAADVTLNATGGRQSATLAGQAGDIALRGIVLEKADFDLSVEDAFGVPMLDGTASLEGLRRGDVHLDRLALVAVRTGTTSSLTVDAALNGSTLAAEGQLTRTGDGFDAALSRFDIEHDGLAVMLATPTTASVAAGVLTLSATELVAGSGSVRVAGRVGERLDVTATLADAPLRIANLLAPQLALEGTLSGDIVVGGTRAVPTATVSVAAANVAAAPLVARGIAPVSLSASGAYARGVATVERLEAALAGGDLKATGTFDTRRRRVSVDLTFTDPGTGLAAETLAVDGDPRLVLALDGAGALSDFSGRLALTADGESLVAGTLETAETNEGLRIAGDITGQFDRIASEIYDPLVTEGTRIVFDLVRLESGGLRIEQADVKSGAATLGASGLLAADLVPVELTVDGRVGRADAAAIALPGDVRIAGADISVRLDAGEPSPFRAEVSVSDLETPRLSTPSITIAADGTATNLSNPYRRAVTFTLSGSMPEVSDGALAEAVGAGLALDVAGGWAAGEPLRLGKAEVASDTFSAAFEGTAGDVVDGTYRLAIADLRAFAALAARDLAGSVRLEANGTVTLAGLFDLSLDASATDVATGVAAVDTLLAGTTRLSGGARRTPVGVVFESLQMKNPQLAASLDGSLDTVRADLVAQARLADLGPLDARAAGPLEARLALSGDAGTPTVAARLSSPRLVLSQKALMDLEAGFDGTWQRTSPLAADIDGRITLGARLDGEPVSLSARIESADERRAVRDLAARVADATASGSLALVGGALLDGTLSLDVPELSRVAPLVMAEASGRLRADLSFTATDGDQDVAVAAEARQLEGFGLSLGYASVDLDVDDAFDVPILDGRAELRALSAAGITVRDGRLLARRDGESSTLTLAADLGTGRLAAAGTLARSEDGFAARVAEFSLTGDGLAARLRAPAAVTVAGRRVTVEDARLAVGDGDLVIDGTVADALDLSARASRVPLAVANLLVPELALAGTVSGHLVAGGTRAAPQIEASLAAEGVSAAILSERGIGPVDASAQGRYADGTATIEALRTTVGGGVVTASGDVGERLDLTVAVDALPLALANAFAPDLGLSGTLSGRGQASGSLEEPSATFDIAVADASAQLLRAADVEPVEARLAGRYAAGAATLETAEARVGGGTVSATGTVGERLDVEVRLSELPLALANAVRPDLALSGTLSGTANALGPLRDPRVTFAIRSNSASAAALRESGVPTASIVVSGTFRDGSVALKEASVRAGEGSLTASGVIGRRLDLSLEATSLPLALANAVQPELGLSGRLAGRVEAKGSLASPRARFDLSIVDFSAQQLRAAALGPLRITADGRSDGRRVILERASAEGTGLAVEAAGTVPLAGSGLDLRVNARAPLALAEPFLASRGATIAGEARADVRVTGALADPRVTGSVSASDIMLRDPLSNVTLEDGRVDARLEGERVVLERATVGVGEGTVSATGTIGLRGGFPADLQIAARNARYADGELVTVTFDADLTVTGPLAGAPRVAGEIRVDRAEVTVPDRLPGSGTLIDVTHFATPRDVLETLRRAKAGPYADVATGDGAEAEQLVLDVSVAAPRRVFIRGRGVDAELGGQVRVTGPISDVRPVGRFELIRGRLVVLTQRIEFVEGDLTLFGDLNPVIHLVAQTRTRSVTVRVILDGPANDPSIRFESDPELPQDEVLAQLLFGRSLSDLSPFQLIQLSAAVAELAGAGGGPSILDQARIVSGLDNLEIVTTESGGTSVQAGRYIADNVYVGVRAGDSSGVTVNLDLTRGLTIRGEALTDESTLGIYYEREY